jgi:hypothetical protein
LPHGILEVVDNAVTKCVARWYAASMTRAMIGKTSTSRAALKLLAADPKYTGSNKPGFLGVLHTWGRMLDYHPHIHYVVPAGGLSDDAQS